MEKYKIYKYTNTINGKVYIGQTGQTIDMRAGYKGYGYKACPYFYNAIQKHGWEAFNCEIIEDNLTRNQANEMEIHYIDFYQSADSTYGYNLTKGGDNVSEQTKKPVYLYSLDGLYIKSFDSISEASIELDINIQSISNCCQGKINTSHGFVFSFEKFDKIPERYVSLQNANRHRKIYKYDLRGSYICEYNNAMEAKQENNISLTDTGITQCCNNSQASAHGFIWSYDKKTKINRKVSSRLLFKTIYTYDMNGKYLKKFNTLQDASLYVDNEKNNKSLISRCCISNLKNDRGFYSSCGYIWSYEYFKSVKPIDRRIIRSKSVYRYSLDGEFIDQFINSKDAALQLFDDETKQFNIKQCCLGNTSHAFGYLWSYDKVEKLNRRNICRKNFKVYQYDLNGNLIFIFNRLKDAMAEINNSNISNCCKGRRNTAGGYIWAYEYYNSLENLKNRKLKYL